MRWSSSTQRWEKRSENNKPGTYNTHIYLYIYICMYLYVLLLLLYIEKEGHSRLFRDARSPRMWSGTGMLLFEMADEASFWSGWWGATTSNSGSSAWRALWSGKPIRIDLFLDVFDVFDVVQTGKSEGSRLPRAAWPRATPTISGRVTGAVLESDV